ncbi:MAG TPA: V4R domain-containing protein [Candidatus Thermoplasmatota archaeon]|nr:V4R domain-containing protein [Candidatus Thermoplasmatota archaeon]
MPAAEDVRRLRANAAMPDALGHAVIATDMEGVILCWNDAARALYGFEAAEVVGKQIYYVLPAALGDEEIEAMMRGFAQGRPWDGILRIRAKDGTWMRTVHSDRVLRGDDGAPACIVSVSFPVARVEAAVEGEREGYVTKDLVRSLLRSMQRAGPESAMRMRELGKGFARRANCPGATVYLELFSTMGLGDLTLDDETPRRLVFSGDDLIERTPGSPHSTCHLPLGFLEGAVEGLTQRRVLGTETRCQSMGAARCVFVVSVR